MFRKGECVLYGFHGVCKILDLEVRSVNKKKIEYYVLEPVEQIGARFYVPTQNEAAAAKLHPIISQKELEEILRPENICTENWITDENQRKQHYKELLSAGDRVALMRMVHTLHRHKTQQKESGRKFHLCDENFLRDAQKLLDAEFAMVLGIPQDQIGSYVQSALTFE